MKILRNIVALAIVAFALLLSQANAKEYTQNSRLSTGKWVRVAIAENGVYELTREELTDMGFADMAKVKIYGYGGHLLPEVLNETRIIDDLLPVKIGVGEDKIFFYAKGLDNFTYSTNGFDRVQNHYANYACYFVTEEKGDANVVPTQSRGEINAETATKESLNYFFHEIDRFSPAKQGRVMLGEALTGGTLTIPVKMPAIKANTDVKYVGRMGLVVSQSSKLYVKLGDDALTFITSQTVNKPSSEREVYKNVIINAQVVPATATDANTLSYQIDNLKEGWLDYVLLTYTQENDFNKIAHEGQMRLHLYNVTSGATCEIASTSNSMIVWSVDDMQNPVQEEIEFQGDKAYFLVKSGEKRYVAFNPTEPLKKVLSYETIENQNLHGYETPDFVIFTTNSLQHKAQELVQLHAENDGISTICVSQEMVFNEFSSGTPDYTAFRHFLKMLYSRNPQKLKNVLFFGPGTYDNRMREVASDDYLLSFESETSNNTMASYVTDDYSVMLGEGTGSNFLRDPIDLGVGRLPAKNDEEADNLIAKIKWHMNNSDYSQWRNNVLVMTDEGDNNSHVAQGEETETMLQTTLGNKFNVHKINVESYYDSKLKVYDLGKAYLRQLFRDGLFYIIYLGHGGETSLSKNAAIWDQVAARNTQYSRFPIMMLAACDIANYDNPYRGWGEKLLVWKDRGALALLTSTRVVESSENHRLNLAFIKALFTQDNKGLVTLGEAYKNAKLSYGSISSRNKLCYTLFADPALKVAYPRPLVKLTTINGDQYTRENVITPMSQVSIEGVIKNEAGDCDETFSGEITLSLLDKKRFVKQLTYNSRPMYIYTDGKPLNTLTTNVVNGRFATTIMVPKDVAASNEKGAFSLFAVDAENTRMANGLCEVVLGDYDATKAVADTKEPIIEKIYLNNEADFSKDAVVESDCRLHVLATDDVSLSLGSNPGAMIRIYLDGFLMQNANNFAKISDGGKKAVISYPMYGLQGGAHTLRVDVSDMAGNHAVKSIDFSVKQTLVEGSATIAADTDVAQSGNEVEFIVTADVADSQSRVYVTDAAENVIWSGACESDAVTWNLKSLSGETVPAGVYYYHAKVTWTGGSCGTEKHRIVVVK